MPHSFPSTGTLQIVEWGRLLVCAGRLVPLFCEGSSICRTDWPAADGASAPQFLQVPVSGKATHWACSLQRGLAAPLLTANLQPVCRRKPPSNKISREKLRLAPCTTL